MSMCRSGGEEGLNGRADVVAGLLGVGEGAPASRGDALAVHEGLGEALAGLQLGGPRRGAEARHTRRRQVVHHAWGKERLNLVQGICQI